MPPIITQDLIAKKLNISRTTVSRSLANHPAISTETRAAVQSMAEELGYQLTPGRTSRRTKLRKSLTLGVLIGIPAEKVEMVTFPHILQGMRESAEAERVSLDIHYQAPGDFHPESSRPPVFRHVRNGDWRGVLLVYPFAEAAVDLIARKLSTVAVLESYSHPSVDSIDTDEVSGIVRLVGELVAAGHKRIGFLTWEYPIGGHWSLQRFGGYVEALFTHGQPFNPDWALNIHKHSPRLETDKLCDVVAQKIRQDHVTAWVCAADHQAYPLIQGLAARGLRVPEDCSVTGFDGLEPPPGLRPVASMKVPHADIGRSAVSRLLNRIIYPHAPRRKILVEAMLVRGASIGPPPKL